MKPAAFRRLTTPTEPVAARWRILVPFPARESPRASSIEPASTGPGRLFTERETRGVGIPRGARFSSVRWHTVAADGRRLMESRRMVEWGTVGAPAGAIIRQLVCGWYCYLMLMPGAPIDTCAVARSEEQIPANETRRHTTAFPPSGRGRGGARTKKPTLECYESRSGIQSAPVPTCPTCTTAESS